MIAWPKAQSHFGAGRDDFRPPALFQETALQPDCRHCPFRAQCVRSPTLPRTLAFRFREQQTALQNACLQHNTDRFKHAHSSRAGVEGAVSQGTRGCDLRQSRYSGLAQTHLQHILTAAAINLMRTVGWLEQAPRAQRSRGCWSAEAW
jgi:transposase